MITEAEWDRLLERTVPIVSAGMGVFSLSLAIMALRRTGQLAQEVYSLEGKSLVSVRYPGQWHDIREFVQPSNPDVVAVYSQYGPDPWNLYNFVCENTEYVADFGEYWRFPSETLRGYGDCEDSAILLTSLIRAGGAPNCYVALGALNNLGHSWCQYNGQVLETTYTRAQPVPDPGEYCFYCMFNESEVIELWPGALDEVFSLRRNEATKLNLIAEAVNGSA